MLEGLDHVLEQDEFEGINSCGASYGFESLLFFLGSAKGEGLVRRTGFHAAEANRASGGHLIVLIADIYKERTGPFGEALLALLAF